MRGKLNFDIQDDLSPRHLQLQLSSKIFQVTSGLNLRQTPTQNDSRNKIGTLIIYRDNHTVCPTGLPSTQPSRVKYLAHSANKPLSKVIRGDLRISILPVSASRMHWDTRTVLYEPVMRVTYPSNSCQRKSKRIRGSPIPGSACASAK